MGQSFIKGDPVHLKDGRTGIFVRTSFGKRGFRYIVSFGNGVETSFMEHEIEGFEAKQFTDEVVAKRIKSGVFVDECNKMGFNSQSEANQKIRKYKKYSSRSKIPQKSYWCNRCKSWHLTSLSENRKHKMIKK